MVLGSRAVGIVFRVLLVGVLCIGLFMAGLIVSVVENHLCTFFLSF